MAKKKTPRVRPLEGVLSLNPRATALAKRARDNRAAQESRGQPRPGGADVSGKPVDWRQHPLWFRCQCDTCMATVGELNFRSNPSGGGRGKMWQNGYGETRKAFRLRYLRFHKHAASKVQP